MQENTALSGGAEAPASPALLCPDAPDAVLDTAPNTALDAIVTPASEPAPGPAKGHSYSTAPATEKALALADWLDDNKAGDLIVIDVTGLNPCMDALIVATAASARHARALADGLLEQSRLRRYEYLRMEGYQAGQWVLVDLNDVVVHLFLAETRELYRIEALWRDAPLLRAPIAGNEHTDAAERAPAVPAEHAF